MVRLRRSGPTSSVQKYRCYWYRKKNHKLVRSPSTVCNDTLGTLGEWHEPQMRRHSLYSGACYQSFSAKAAVQRYRASFISVTEAKGIHADVESQIAETAVWRVSGRAYDYTGSFQKCLLSWGILQRLCRWTVQCRPDRVVTTVFTESVMIEFFGGCSTAHACRFPCGAGKV
jgi:hypothetical protein